FVHELEHYIKKDLVTFLPRHQVDELILQGDIITGIKGSILDSTNVKRGEKSNRKIKDELSYEAQAVVIASGGRGANYNLVRKSWPHRLDQAPMEMITGVPEHVDGRMLEITDRIGGRIVNRDDMWQ